MYRQIAFVALLLAMIPLSLLAEDQGGQDDTVKYPTEMSSFELTVTNEKGDPIEGVSIDPYGMRCVEVPSTGWFWPTYNTGKIKTIKTGANGKATVPYPVKFGRDPDWMTASEVSLSISHPEFISDELVTDPRNGNAAIELRAGCRLTFSAVNAAGSQVPFGVMVAGPGRSAKWQDGDAGARYSQAIPDGTWQTIVVSPDEDGEHLFSPLIPVRLRDGQSVNIRKLKLKPGLRLRGQLDDNVPRPVTKGKVVVHCLPKPAGNTWSDESPSVEWMTSAAIAHDGTFEVPSIPRQGTVQLIAICSGFVGKNENAPEANNSFRQGIFIELDGENVQEVTIPMEATASVKVKVLKPDGTPLAGAGVGMSPNQMLHLGGSNIVGEAWESVDQVKKQIDPSHELPSPDYRASRYWKTTNDEGIAVINDVPATGRESVAIGHDDFVVPFEIGGGRRRERAVQLEAGKVSKLEVKVIDKEDAMSHQEAKAVENLGKAAEQAADAIKGLFAE